MYIYIYIYTHTHIYIYREREMCSQAERVRASVCLRGADIMLCYDMLC